MPLARAISRGAFLKARLGVNGIQNGSRSLGTAVARASLLACGMSASRMDAGARAPGAWPTYSSRIAGTESRRGWRQRARLPLWPRRKRLPVLAGERDGVRGI